LQKNEILKHSEKKKNRKKLCKKLILFLGCLSTGYFTRLDAKDKQEKAHFKTVFYVFSVYNIGQCCPSENEGRMNQSEEVHSLV